MPRRTLAHARWRSRGLRGGMLAALLGAVLGACGGGGGGGAAPAVDLGLVSRTVPTESLRAFTNPLGVQATLSEPSPGSLFRIRAGALPVVVAGGASVSLPVVCTPDATGVVSGALDLLWQGDGGSQATRVAFRATAEAVQLVARPALLDFATLGAGATADLPLALDNPSLLSPVTVSAVDVTGAGVSVLGSLPASVPPGGSLELVVRATSAGGDPLEGALRVGPSDVGADVRVPLYANIPAREEVTDFGTVALTGGLSPLLSVHVPADAISLTLEGVGSSAGDRIGLGELTGPGGRVYEDSEGTGPYTWLPGQPVFTAQVPNTDRVALQLVPGGGTYTFRLSRGLGTGGSARVRAIVERRPGGLSVDGVLPLNIWLVPALGLDTSTAPLDARMQEVLAGMDSILQAQGVRLGDIDWYLVDDERFNSVSEVEFPELLALTSAASEVRMNLFFVQQALGGGVVGVAGTITGPRLNGTNVSGAMCAFPGLPASQVAVVATHEVGHYLGLWHTTEQDGQHDFIDDTLECPAYSNAGNCDVPGGGYLMHWLVTGRSTISDGQGRVIRGHALLEPGPQPSSKLRPARAPVVLDSAALPPGWCGTCAPHLRLGR